MRLSGMSPFGPIFGKELRTSARRKRNYVLRVAYLAGLLIFLLLAFEDSGGMVGNGAAARIGQQQELGRTFFFTFSFFCIFAMALIGPVVTCTAINGERQAKTLHVLLMTPLTAWQIVSGKLLSRLLTALTLIGLSLPVLALVRLLGGVELTQMFAVLSLCSITALFTASLGLLFSILNRRAYAAILLAYFLMAILYFFTPMLILTMQTVAPVGRIATLDLLSIFNPFVALAMTAGFTRVGANAWIYCAIIHLVATALLLIASAVLVRRLARREGEGAPVAADAITPPSAALTDPLGAAPISSVSRKTRKLREVSDSPVLWRELRRPLMSKRRQRIAFTIVCLVLLGLAYLAAAVNNALDDAAFQVFIGNLFFTGLLLLTCVIAATSIAQEKEGDTWPILVASPLSGRSIVWSKAAGVARRLLWPNVLVAAHLIAFTIVGVIPPACAIIALTIMIFCNTIWLASGIYFSLRFRKVSVAVMANLAMPLLLYVALPLVLVVVDEVSQMHGNLASNVLWSLPYFFLTEGLSGVSRGHLFQLPIDQYAVDSAWTYARIVMTVGLIYAAVACAILGWAASRFDAMVGRTRQREPLAEKIAPIASSPAIPNI